MTKPQMREDYINIRDHVDYLSIAKAIENLQGLADQYGGDAMVEFDTEVEYCGDEIAVINLYFERMETQEEADRRGEAQKTNAEMQKERDLKELARLQKLYNTGE